MEQLGFHIKQNICMGCKACVVSCKDKNDLAVGLNYRRVYSFETGGYNTKNGSIVPDIKAYFVSIACNHCDMPACMASCPMGAITKEGEHGIVMINEEICNGCKECVKACPYGAPQYNEATKKVEKCQMCADLREKEQDPVCVSTCPMRAIEYGPVAELRQKYGKTNQINGLPSPSVTYPNLVITPHRDATL